MMFYTYVDKLGEKTSIRADKIIAVQFDEGDIYIHVESGKQFLGPNLPVEQITNIIQMILTHKDLLITPCGPITMSSETKSDNIADIKPVSFPVGKISDSTDGNLGFRAQEVEIKHPSDSDFVDFVLGNCNMLHDTKIHKVHSGFEVDDFGRVVGIRPANEKE